MKLYYMLMLLVGLSTQLEAQEIQIVEYFFDQDPGYGNGTALTIKNDQEMELNLDIPVNSLTVGFHQLYVRAMDKNGHWSHTNKVNFYRLKSKLTGATPIHKLEYFIDTDPGFGNGNALSFDSEAEDLIQNYLIDLSTTDPGFHILRVRAMDQFGNWSMTLEQGFYVVPEKKEITNIIALKYYFVTKDSISQTYVHNLATPTLLLDIQFSVNTDFLKQDQDYTMYVWALGSNGSSSLIETVPFKYGHKKNNAPPEVIGSLSDLTLPVGFGSKNIEIGSVFSDPDNDPLTYEVSSSNESVVTVDVKGGSLNLKEVGPGKSTITVTAKDGKGGEVKASFEVVVANPNSTEDDLLKQSLMIYPNPGDGFFNLELNHQYKGQVLVSISGIDGKEQFHQTLNKNNQTLTQSINLKGMAAGLYLLKIKTDNAAAILRLVVNP